jgi:hypothetical protein
MEIQIEEDHEKECEPEIRNPHDRLREPVELGLCATTERNDGHGKGGKARD